MRHPRTVGLLRLTTLFAILLTVPLVSAQQIPEIIVSYPTGALAFFPRSVNQDESKVQNIYLRADRGLEIWVVDATPVLVPGLSDDGSLKVEKATGFFVPQLPRGRYVAWYQSPAETVRQSITFEIVPQLLGDVGITRGTPGREVEVAIKIYSPHVARPDDATPITVIAEITLSSVDSNIADLAQNQRPTVVTNREGIATWRIYIKQPGIVPFTATAKGFESTTIAVVGMPSSAPTYLEAAVLASEMRARRLEITAQQASESVEKLNDVREAQKDQPMARTGDEATSANRASRLQVRINALNRVAIARNAEASAARMELENLKMQQAAQPSNLSESDLKPGDILLVRGTTPIVEFGNHEIRDQRVEFCGAVLTRINLSGQSQRRGPSRRDALEWILCVLFERQHAERFAGRCLPLGRHRTSEARGHCPPRVVALRSGIGKWLPNSIRNIPD